MSNKLSLQTKPLRPLGHGNYKSWWTAFHSGQIPIDPATGDLVSNGIKAESKQCMNNLLAILSEAKLTFEHVVKQLFS